MRRLGADLPDHLLGGGAQDIGHDGLESVGGCFHWFVSFEEWRRPEKRKAARWGGHRAACVTGWVSVRCAGALVGGSMAALFLSSSWFGSDGIRPTTSSVVRKC